MQTIINDLAWWIEDYFDTVESWLVFISVIIFAVVAPFTYGATGKKIGWLRPQIVLSAYGYMLFGALFTSWALGVSLYYWAPDIFEAWQPRVFSENKTPITYLYAFAHSLITAFAISSVLYGVQNGLQGIAYALSGILFSFILWAFYVFFAILIACYGWANCI